MRIETGDMPACATRSGCVNRLCLDGDVGAWRSLVAHLPWEQGVGRSNRLAPIEEKKLRGKAVLCMFKESFPESLPERAPVAQMDRATAF